MHAALLGRVPILLTVLASPNVVLGYAIVEPVPLEGRSNRGPFGLLLILSEGTRLLSLSICVLVVRVCSIDCSRERDEAGR